MPAANAGRPPNSRKGRADESIGIAHSVLASGEHVLVWLIPSVVVVTAVVLYIWMAARGDCELSASPFIDDS